MDIDINKFRTISSFSNSKGDYDRDTLMQQSIEEFDYYLETAPNRHYVYLNNSTTPIPAIFQDVSDLEIRTDSKWMLTSLKYKVNAGDIITWNSRRWMCIYDKEKNTASCYKVKVQPCNYLTKLAVKNLGTNEYFVYDADSIIMTYLTDMKEFKQPFPSETGTTFVTTQFNEYTNQLRRQDRVWLYDSAFEITGVDFTNIDFYLNKGFLKWTLRPDKIVPDLDRPDLRICDYYKYFEKPIGDNVLTDNYSTLNITSLDKVKCGEMINISVNGVSSSEKISFTFDGDNLGCTLTQVGNQSCILNAFNEIGIIYIKAHAEGNVNSVGFKRIIIEG